MTFTKHFKSLTKNNTDIAGGKGASLGEMMQANIPVPEGFVILTNAYEKFLDETDLRQEIRSELNDAENDKIHTIERASKNIQNLILNAKIPQNIRDEIQKEFKNLNTKFVAVRSSATAEDSKSAAWAGQLDTFLNTTEDDLIEKVKRCWASLFTPRAIFYRFEQGLKDSHISVAVVIQKMIDSEKSGIAFSVHPVTEDKNQLIIEAGFGLGESIVSGQITPDAYTVSKKDNQIIDININEQIKALYRNKDGGNIWQELKEKGKEQVLTKEQIIELSNLIKQIENHYDNPQDIEWAYENGKFYITQSRPITTLSNNNKPQTIFEKVYTRDTTIIIQQMWYKSLKANFDRLGRNKTYDISVIHYMNGGSIELWENIDFTQKLMDRILKENEKSELFFNKEMENYESTLGKLHNYWKQGKISDLLDFKKVINLVDKGMLQFTFIYYSSLDERTPKLIRKKALEMREKDEYYDNNDRLFRDSMIDIYPELKGFENTILKSEIKDLPIKDIQEKRLKKFVFIGEEYANLESIEDYALKNKQYKFKFDPVPINAEEFKGQTGYKGLVRGKIRLVKRKALINSVKEGDIIVAPMTTPEYLPAMKKASAFITDEGGITCHAAIIAREMKKPCIIGTKIATQVLKDGDMVEVDADNGIVRILETNK